MPDVGDLLAVVFSDAGETGTVHATVREWHDLDRCKALAEARMQREPEKFRLGLGFRILMLPLRAVIAVKQRPQPGVPDDPIAASTLEIWFDRPTQFRVERSWRVDDGHDERLATVGKQSGKLWRPYDETSYDLVRGHAARTSRSPFPNATQVERHFSPKFRRDLVGALTLEGVGETVVAGRPAISVRARERDGDDAVLWPHWLPAGFAADNFDLSFEAERGDVLAMSGRAGDDVIATVEVTSITYDEPVATERFRLP